MYEDKKKRSSYILWNLKRKLHYLKSERPLLFNIYDTNSGKKISFSISTEQLTLDDLKDPNKRIALVNIDYDIEEIESAIKELEEEQQKEKDLKRKRFKK